MERLNLLVSDLDGTLLGDTEALSGFTTWYGQRRSSLRLIYSSGRFLSSIRSSIDEFNLPRPDAIIGGVGTVIYDNIAGHPIPDWPRVSSDWNVDVIRSTCAAYRELEEQPEQFLSNYKISYHGQNLDEQYLAELRRQLMRAGQDVSIVYSSNRDLDILPAGTSKGAAISYLASRWQLAREDLLVAGDSGNDLDMFNRGYRGIVVGNAHSELRQLRGEHVYHATGSFAAGVVEGLQHWLDRNP